jgi:hypothetical protein
MNEFINGFYSVGNLVGKNGRHHFFYFVLIIFFTVIPSVNIERIFPLVNTDGIFSLVKSVGNLPTKIFPRSQLQDFFLRL